MPSPVMTSRFADLLLVQGSNPHATGSSPNLVMSRIEPYVEICDEVVIDFSGVRHANSSFVNALVAGLVERHGRDVLKILVFKGCNPVVRVLIDGAIALGLQKIEGRIDA